MAHPGTVGNAFRGAMVKIFDHSGAECLIGQPGEIYTSSPWYPRFTYHNKPAQRLEVERGGLITCGDMGYLDEDGFLFLCDRKRDMVIPGGVNIYPVEIENVLITHAAVADCAVFGVPNEELGECLLVAIQLAPGGVVTVDELIDFLKQKISNYKVPRLYEFHDQLPREGTGKIFKRKLRDPYWERANA